MGIGGGGKFNPFQPIELLRQPGPPPFRQTVGPMKQGLVYHVHSQTPTAPVRETNTEAPASPGPRHPDAASQSWAGSSQSWAGSCLPGLLPVPKVPCCMAGNSLCRRGEGIHCVTESGRGRGGGRAGLREKQMPWFGRPEPLHERSPAQQAFRQPRLGLGAPAFLRTWGQAAPSSAHPLPARLGGGPFCRARPGPLCTHWAPWRVCGGLRLSGFESQLHPVSAV